MAKTAKSNMSDARRFLTEEFRVSYPNLFKPQSLQGSKPKFSITMLFKKTIDLSRLRLAMKHAKIDEFGPDKSQWPDCESPVEDGDDPKHADKEGYAGHWVIKATSSEERKPGLVNEDVEDIINVADFYPGCYAIAQIWARVWEFPKGSGRYGVQFIVDHVQKTRDGKSFSNRKDAKDVFAPIGGGKKRARPDEDDDDNEMQTRSSKPSSGTARRGFM